MKTRINYAAAAPQTVQALIAAEKALVTDSGLPHALLHLVKLRASILNGCAFCVDMHTKEARRDGMAEQWINLIATWHESPVYSDRERAALEWTDALTLLSQTKAPDESFTPLRAHFSDEEIVKLTAVIGMINVWNRIAVGMRVQHPVEKAAKAA
jgi:AhpD family alkylhydroperoxidase